MKKIRKEYKTSYRTCSLLHLCVLCLGLFASCAKKISPFTQFSAKQCIAHANQYQKQFSAMHGEIKVTLNTLSKDKINLLADFQIDPDGKMMLSMNKLGFTVAFILIRNEDMLLWSVKENEFWGGSVAQGLDRIFAVKMNMQDFMRMFYVSWNDQDDFKIKESSKWISFQPEKNIWHKISKKDCRLDSSELELDFNGQSNTKIKTTQYIELPSKKMIPKKNSVHHGQHQIKLSLNQVFEQAFNDKKWNELQEKFLKQMKKQ